MKLNTRGLGMILLPVWLILMGLFSLLSINFAHQGQLLDIVAIAAGIFLLMGR